jgi:peptide chain release factor subunit 1
VKVPSRNSIGALTLTDGLLRDLAGFRSERAPVTSCYLDVDGRRFIRPQDLEPHLDDLLRRGRRRMASTDGPGAPDRAAVASVEADLRRISDYVRGGLDRSSTRGLAMFSCSAEHFWHVVELAVPVPNVIVVNTTPHIRVLESVIDQHQRFAVLLVDRQRARIFLFEQRKLVEKQDHFDRLPRHDDDGGQMDRDHLAGHTQAAAAHHLRRAAQAAFAVYQEQAFDHLVLGTPDSLAREMERELHPWLRDRIAARLTIPVGARDDEIVQAALEVESRVERAREAALVEKLRQAVGSGSGAAVGLADVLAALVARRVDTLLVSEGYEAPGWRCPGCAYVGVRGRRCPVCSAEMHQVDDVVEEAVEEALNQSCRLAICRGDADLDVLGRIGATLRF